ncbi:hypothetical protein HAX54_030180 [Datura stramonium]|uniref:Uncharacterized protein n=1 Tax=Datura stramonium TaxID=4076 RepID=A0ABS8V7B5_DATST|nr:hypothetical protein [Datura stramonium]
MVQLVRSGTSEKKPTIVTEMLSLDLKTTMGITEARKCTDRDEIAMNNLRGKAAYTPSSSAPLVGSQWDEPPLSFTEIKHAAPDDKSDAPELDYASIGLGSNAYFKICT